MENLIGYLAAFCTTVAFVPQVIKVYRTKSTGDISLGMFTLMTTGIGGWLIYGLMLNAPPIIAANFISFIMAFYIFMVKMKHYNRDRLIKSKYPN